MQYLLQGQFEVHWMVDTDISEISKNNFAYILHQISLHHLILILKNCQIFTLQFIAWREISVSNSMNMLP